MVAQKRTRRGLIIVLSAPSGCGKTTVARQLLAGLRNLRVSISTTTRRPRPGEHDGVDYHFMTRREFRERKTRGEFLEWAQVFGEYYGTAKAFVDRTVRSGKDALLVIDVQGMKQVKLARPCLSIFILPPSFTELERRLAGRRTDSHVARQQRLAQAREEITAAHWYDYRVVNHTVSQAVTEIRDIIRRSKKHVSSHKPLSYRRKPVSRL